MTFGLLTTKWRILRSTLRCSSVKNSKIIQACMMLHNFCIRMKQRDEGWKLGDLSQCAASLRRLGGGAGIDRSGCCSGCNQFGFMPTVQEEDESDSEEDADNDDTGIDGSTDEVVVSDGDDKARDCRRSDIVREIFTYEIVRPMHNKRRNNRSQVDEDDMDDEFDGDEEDMDEFFYEQDEEDCE